MIRKVIRRLKKWLNPPQKFIPVTTSFVQSAEYEALMHRYLPFPGIYDNHEAQNQTSNFQFRHHQVNHRLGVFRWRGIHRNKERILQSLQGPNKVVIDLGGAAGPLGLGSIIVDFLEKDAYGNEVPYKFLKDVQQEVDVVFTSHTLEHIPNLENLIEEVKEVLKPHGEFFIHIPAFYCERWRAGTHTNKLYNDHVWTFGLAGSEVPENLQNYLEIDSLLSKYFEIELKEYCGDDSIFIICKKN